MIDNIGLMKLMTWLSPSFPVGAYTYSHGVEYAVEVGLVSSGQELQEWTEGALLFGAGQVDGLFFREAYLAAEAFDIEALMQVNNQAIAMRPTFEMALESEAQGRAFNRISEELSSNTGIMAFSKAHKEAKVFPAYPAVVGAISAFEGISCEAALTGFLHAFVANIISSGVRLIPLGQTEGQKALTGLEGTVLEVVSNVMNKNFEDIGSSAPVIDWTSMKHETQYTRLFRS